MAEGDTVRTIVKFLSHEQSKEREEATYLLHELSKSETLSEKIGSVNGAILILVGMASSKSENVLTVEKADKTLKNLEKCENNVKQMADYGKLQPLLTLILEGTSPHFDFFSHGNFINFYFIVLLSCLQDLLYHKGSHITHITIRLNECCSFPG